MASPAWTKFPIRKRNLHARDFIIILSLANVCFIRVWQELEGFTWESLPAMKSIPTPVVLSAVMFNILLLAGLFTLVTALVRDRARGGWENVGRAVFVAGLALPAFGVYRVVSERYQFLRGEMIRAVGTAATVAIWGAVTILFVTVVWRHHERVARWSAIILVALSPGVLVTFGRAIHQIATYRPDTMADRPVRPLKPNARTDARVLWILFDEWDYRLTFVDRQRGLELPEIDAFAGHALTATNAIPPARATIASIPMLLAGERYTAQNIEGPNTFRVRPIDEPDRFHSWSSRKHIFREAQGLNFNTALVGWYLPYCRVLTDDLNGCDWLPIENQRNSVRRDTIPHAMFDQTRSLFETSLFSPFGQSLTVRKHVLTYTELLGHALRYTTDPRYGVVFVHLPAPHSPFTYDRATASFSRANSPVDGYYDSLALVDRTVGELRRALQSAGEWDRSTIVLTSDHYFRSANVLDGKSDFRVPMMLKLAGQTKPLAYDRRFNTLYVKPLLSAVLHGAVRTPEEAAEWLNQKATVFEPQGQSDDQPGH